MPEFGFTELETQFAEALAIIAVACVAVPLFRRLGLGTILGYLATGVTIHAVLAVGFAEHPEDLLHFAEFGVVLFLFVIGLELNPSMLWRMRRDIFGLGLCQTVVCGGVLAIPAYYFGLPWQAALVAGLGLALSSTALVMQTLEESGDRVKPYGRKAFSILLFQDLAIVPLLLLVALLAPASGEKMDLAAGLQQVGIAVVAIAVLVVTGKYLLDPVFRRLARTGVPEIMTAFALGVVIAAALLMALAGMSYAMGAFIAGVMLSESSYRHEIEADIEPFRGLFLGLFFVAVGVSLDLSSVAANWFVILVAVPAAMLLKTATIYALARIPVFSSGHNDALQTATILSQFGEFGFVLFAAAAGGGVIPSETAAILVAIVTLSMAAAPLVNRLTPRLLSTPPKDHIEEDFSDAGGRVLVIGFGRFGQMVSQPLRARAVSVTVLDNDAERVREAAHFGFRIHYGDGTRRDIMRAAGAESADVIAVCVDRPGVANEIVRLARASFPAAKLFVRAYDRSHSIDLRRAGVDGEVRETVDSGFRMGGLVLAAIGFDRVDETLADLRERDERRLDRQTAAAKDAGIAGEEAIHVTPEPL